MISSGVVFTRFLIQDSIWCIHWPQTRYMNKRVVDWLGACFCYPYWPIIIESAGSNYRENRGFDFCHYFWCCSFPWDFVYYREILLYKYNWWFDRGWIFWYWQYRRNWFICSERQWSIEQEESHWISSWWAFVVYCKEEWKYCFLVFVNLLLFQFGCSCCFQNQWL